MKKSDVKVGGVYAAKVTNKVVPVRIDAENPHGGWDATNRATGKKVRIKSAQRLRGPWQKQFRDQMRAVHKADQENARLAEDRSKSPDGMTASERAMAKSAPKAKKTAKASKKAKKAPKRDTGKRRGTSAKPKRLSILDAAVKVLEAKGEAMNCKAMIAAMADKKLWTSSAATPAATLYSAILREMQKKGREARFTKVDRGKFALTE